MRKLYLKPINDSFGLKAETKDYRLRLNVSSFQIQPNYGQ